MHAGALSMRHGPECSAQGRTPLPILPRTVSEAPRPREEIGWRKTVSVAAVVSIRRDEGSLSIAEYSIGGACVRKLGEGSSTPMASATDRMLCNIVSYPSRPGSG
jgi:hypothetical protein